MAITQLKDCDVLYVVGDVKSNNTAKLVDVGRNHGIKKVLLIQNFLDIDLEDLRGANKVCVTAGASTPPSLINEVIEYLRTKTADQTS